MRRFDSCAHRLTCSCQVWWKSWRGRGNYKKIVLYRARKAGYRAFLMPLGGATGACPCKLFKINVVFSPAIHLPRLVQTDHPCRGDKLTRRRYFFTYFIYQHSKTFSRLFNDMKLKKDNKWFYNIAVSNFKKINYNYHICYKWLFAA